jgi:alkylglycerol monooxygenase
MTSAQVIVLATPVFLLLIALEWAVRLAPRPPDLPLGRRAVEHRAGHAQPVVAVFSLAFTAGCTCWCSNAWRCASCPWSRPWVWLSALLLYDFCYYWHHRLGHRCALFWAAHVVHHQSEDYNLSTALRQTGSGWLFGWVFYLPMALLGVPPLVFGTVALIDLLYQFWVHTQQIGRLGWFDRWFCSPSNHRVHHAVNDRYLDRNYGGILMVWDRLFGSFVEEDDLEPIVYGTRKPLRSWNPLWANLRSMPRWRATAGARAPGPTSCASGSSRPAGGRRTSPRAGRCRPFDLARVQRFDPPMSPAAIATAVALFAVALGLTAAFLWNAHRWPLVPQLAAAGSLLLLLWWVARLGGRSA